MTTTKMISYPAKSLGIAVLLTLFFGLLGFHRFYMERIFTGIVMAIMSITVILLPLTIIWNLFDLILVSGWVHDYNTVEDDK